MSENGFGWVPALKRPQKVVLEHNALILILF